MCWAPLVDRRTRYGSFSCFFELILDPRESVPMLVPMGHADEQSNRIKARHDLWIRNCLNHPKAHGIPFTGLSHPRPETAAIGEKLRHLRDELPFDPLEFLDWMPPFENSRDNCID